LRAAAERRPRALSGADRQEIGRCRRSTAKIGQIRNFPGRPSDCDARLQCCADFYLHPQHDGRQVRAALEDVALTSPYLYFDDPVAIAVSEKPWATHYRLRAYPVDAAQQFRFISDLTVRGKAVLNDLGLRFAKPPAVAE